MIIQYLLKILKKYFKLHEKKLFLNTLYNAKKINDYKKVF